MSRGTNKELRALRSRRGASVPLFVIAGLPKETAVPVQTALQGAQDLKVARYVTVDFGGKGGPIYTTNKVHALIASTGAFALRTRRSTELNREQIAPSRLYLLYVPSPEAECLLQAFDFFCMPIPILSGSGEPDWRFDLKQSLVRIRRAVRRVAKDSDSTVRYLHRKVTQTKKETPLRLPPQNFALKEGLLAQSFRVALRPGGNWRTLKSIKATKFLKEDLPRALKGKKRAYLYQDERGIVFPPDPTRHGPARELPKQASFDDFRRVLNQLFRFGMPLSDGYHHDAQYPGTRAFTDVEFWCSRNGSLRVSGPYANVYPNDFVRLPKKK